MNKKLFTALTLAVALLIGGPAFGNGRAGSGGRGASFTAGGARSGARGGSFAFGGSSRGYTGGRGGYGYGRGYGYSRGYGYRRGYVGYAYGYPYYDGDDYGYGYVEPAYPAYTPAYSTSNDGDSVSMQVQAELAREGYYQGPIDGIVGPGTQAAISAYQRDNGLRVTGTINGHLLDALDLD